MNKKSLKTLLFFGLMLFILNGCSTQDNQSGSLDYEQTKKLVVDILKTDDGKKALKEVLADESLKQELVLNDSVVNEAVGTTLVSDKGKDFWKKAFEDPKFAEAFATSMKEQYEKLQKDLLKDPEYRKGLMEILHDPEMEKELTELLKSTDYRDHLKEVVTETIESPLYQAKIQDILLKAAEETSKKKEEGE